MTGEQTMKPGCCEITNGVLTHDPKDPEHGVGATFATLDQPGTDIEPVAAAPALRDEFRDAEDYLQQALITLDELATAHPDDAYGLAAAMLIANRLKKNATLLSERVELLLHELIPDKQMVVDGIGVIEKSRQSKGTEWDQDATWRSVKHLLRPEFMDEETGEFDPERQELVETVIDLVRGLVSPPVWRKTALRAQGLEPEGDLCESRYGRKTVRIYASGENR